MPPPTAPARAALPKGSRTRASIVDAAATAFCTNGFEASRLEDIGDALGLTRSAVLYHFPSKVDLLLELVRPAIEGIDVILDELPEGRVLPPRQQRAFLRRFLDHLLAHRAALTILTRDVGSHRHLPADLQLTDRVARFAAHVVDGSADPLGTVRAVSALGALARPLGVDASILALSSDTEREALVECALAALRSRPRPAG